jgi:hypothetical protein
MDFDQRKRKPYQLAFGKKEELANKKILLL